MSGVWRGYLILFLTAVVPAWQPLGAASDETAVLTRMKDRVLPVLEKYCIDCHDAETRKADIDLGLLWNAGTARLDVRLWDKVEEQLRTGLMPPPKKDQPQQGEREAVLEWVGQAEKAVRAQAPIDPGFRKARRLTRKEYGRSMRDLLGLAKADLGDSFPADGAGGEGFENNADTLFMSPLLIEKYVDAADRGLEAVWQQPELVRRLLLKQPGDGVAASAAARVNLQAFASRAFRRPATGEEIAPLLGLFERAMQGGHDFESAIRLGFKAILLSPKFLILQEVDLPGQTKPWRVSGHEMAARLSYFLWSSLPDDELRQAAEAGKLNDADELERQVRRMLKDERAEGLVTEFAAQWLGLHELFNTVDPDRRKYPEFTPSLRQAMYDEGHAFAGAILRENGRLLDFIDSRYTYANQELAKLYGIGGVSGAQMRRVDLPDERRGGVLGMAGILATTAYPQRTSPVLRGKWVLEQLMGTPAPPPPANVGSLPEDDRKLTELTFRQQLERHRSKPECMGCHKRLDPPGFGLENFDPIGKWRDSENGKALDVQGNLADGRIFTGPAEMRRILMEEKHKFVRNFCTRLLGYALGRGLEPYDQPTLLRLEETLVKNDYRSLPLILALVQSYPFTHRRAATRD